MVRKNLSNIHWTRFESWVNQGVPDLHGISDGINIFVELKVKIILPSYSENDFFIILDSSSKYGNVINKLNQ
mgnify:CR=1 FL=1